MIIAIKGRERFKDDFSMTDKRLGKYAIGLTHVQIHLEDIGNIFQTKTNTRKKTCPDIVHFLHTYSFPTACRPFVWR